MVGYQVATAGSNIASRVSPGEWQARVELAAMYRLAAHYRWTDTIYNHISSRVPGEETILINPFGMLYDEVTASSLVKINLDGEIVDDPFGWGINKAGFVIHGAVHVARHDVGCVMHTHTRAGVAVAAQEHGLLPISQTAAFLMGRIGYHDFEGIALRMDEQERLIDNLGEKPILILRNHGLLVAGEDPAETFTLMNFLERACEIQIAAQSGCAQLRLVGEDEIRNTQVVGKSGNARNWSAMLRLLDRVAPDYKI